MLDVRILRMVEGAREAEGLAVIVDILRAGSVITTLLHNKALHVAACGELEVSYALQKEGYLLSGERNGIPPQGFDYPNSPSLLSKIDFNGKRIAVNTQAGSQGIINATKAEDVIVGGFMNHSAVARYIMTRKPSIVSIIAMGYCDSQIRAPAQEDEEYATFLRNSLSGREGHYEEIVARLAKLSPLQRFFDPTNTIFPEEDFHFCLSLDTSYVVPMKTMATTVHKPINGATFLINESPLSKKQR